MFRMLFFAGLVSIAAAAPAGASSGGAEATRLAGSEIRVGIWDGEAEVSHLWRLYPGGRVTGATSAMYLRGRQNYFREMTDTGTWTQQGNVLCLTWTRISGGGQHCYRVTVRGKQISLSHTRNGRVSRGTIAPLPGGPSN